MKISIKNICGKNTVTRDDGKKINAEICAAWKGNEPIEIDFGNIIIASVSFMDQAIGLLAKDHSRDELVRKLKLTNITSRDKNLLNEILISRYRQKNLLPHTSPSSSKR